MEQRAAFYALSPGGWRDVVTILHPPYTAWHLSYVALGAAVAPEFHAVRLWAALGAFFLGVGIAAHALDELNGHPLGTRLSDRTLAVLAGVALAGAVGIGIAGLFVVSFTLLPFVLAGAFGVVAYNLELFGGRFHTDFWFAAAWGAFPALAATNNVLVLFYDHIGLSVTDLDGWVAKLREEGVRFLEEPYRLGDTRAVMIEGPSREALELVEVGGHA